MLSSNCKGELLTYILGLRGSLNTMDLNVLTDKRIQAFSKGARTGADKLLPAVIGGSVGGVCVLIILPIIIFLVIR